MGILTKRLSALASMVEKSARVIDVGTDHGLIPVFLAQNRRCLRIIASDIREGPLSAAIENAVEYGVSDNIEFMLSPGLEGISDSEVDTVIIAGMGGETIMSILSDAAWVKSQEVKLILQPQTKLFELLAWLFENGFKISGAALVSEDGRIYTVLSAETGGGGPSSDDFFDLLIKKEDRLLKEYLTRQIEKLQKEIQGKLMSSVGDAGLTESRKRLEALMRVKSIAEEEYFNDNGK